MKKPIILIGVGFMGTEYAKVLKEIKIPVLAFGRGKKSASTFKEATGIEVITESVSKENIKNASSAIIATNIESLGEISKKVIDLGIKNILIEKPGGVDSKDISKTYNYIKKHRVNAYVAYNRRWFSSTQEAEKIIKKDGGVSSFTFDFTEKQNPWGDIPTPSNIKKNWLLANSSHIIDLAFFLGGYPITMSSKASHKLPWNHPGIFIGYGQSNKKAFFSYHANWHAPGRWKLEIMTKKNKLILCPIEKLQIQKLNSFLVEDVPLSNDLDQKFKPGLYKQIEDFLSKKPKKLPTFEKHYENLKHYYKILNRKFIA